MNEEQKKVIDSIKMLGLDMIDSAKSGHPGIVLGAAPIMYTLFANHLNINPSKPDWINRDRFVLSAGHGSALLYSTLFMAGYNIDIEELKKFRKLNSTTPGHPELNINYGVEMTTGPLGQGFASAVGMAIAEKYISSKINIKNNIIDYNTYVLCSDGDLMEGISYEAASLAGTLKLNKLIVLYDSNNVCLDGNTSKVFTENVTDRFKALGWHTETVKKGEDIKSIDKAINNAKKVIDKPSLIEIKTIIGKGSLYEGTSTVHGKPLDSVDLDKVRQKLNVRDIPFAVSKESATSFRNLINIRSLTKFKKYENDLKIAEVEEKNNLKEYELEELNINLENLFKDFTSESSRITSGKIINTIANNTNYFIGGSADLSSSTKTYIEGSNDFSATNYSGKNINFGVREHTMGAVLNGLALSKLRVFGSTFMVFSDYMKPAIRMSALMKLPVIYIFTHDSIAVGEDGPTHEPIEQLAMLRSIPNLDVYRPADAHEVVGSYIEALKKKDGPTAIILSRSELKLHNTTSIDISKGGYIAKKEKANLSGIIIATGKELDNALMTAYNLEAKGLDIRVVSMPNPKLFLKQNGKYINDVLPLNKKIIVIEAASSYGWHQFTSSKNIIAIDTFGKSGSEQDVYEDFKFDLKNISEKVEKLLG